MIQKNMRGLFGKLYILAAVLLWCIIYLLHINWQFGDEPLTVTYTESSYFQKRVQQDADILAAQLRELISTEDETTFSVLSTQLTDYWKESNFDVSMVFQYWIDGRKWISSNDAYNGYAVYNSWQYYYQHNLSYNNIRASSFLLEEDWKHMYSPIQPLYNITVFFADFEHPDIYATEKALFERYAKTGYLTLFVYSVTFIIFISYGLYLYIKKVKPNSSIPRICFEELVLLTTLLLFSGFAITQNSSLLTKVLTWSLISIPLLIFVIIFSHLIKDRHQYPLHQNSLLIQTFLHWPANRSHVIFSFFLLIFTSLLFLIMACLSILPWLAFFYLEMILLIFICFLLHHNFERLDFLQEFSSISQGLPISSQLHSTFYQHTAKLLDPISEQVRDLIDQRMKVERLKVDLITNVSHDLKTPLTSIITYIRLLEKETSLPEKPASYLQVLSDKTLQLKALTEDLIEAARLTSGNEKFTPQHLNFGEMLRQANGEFAESMDKSELELISSIPNEELPAWIDSNKTWRIISNLYGNACKHAMPGTRLYVDAGLSEDTVWFCMKNTSRLQLNIPPEMLLERFMQGDPSRSNGGNGLGLTIARELTQLQGGTFDLEIYGDLFMVKLSLPRYKSEDRPLPNQYDA